jgi:high-affinity nickel-transport protein
MAIAYRLAATPRRETRLSFTPGEWRRLAAFYGVIAALHVAGWGLYLHYAGTHPALVGLGFVAYMFGLRHAFDADHIAAIDDTVRFLLQKGKRPLGVGFFFSLGHSTVVLVLAVAIAIAASAVASRIPEMKEIGSLIGLTVSGSFLLLIGLLNLVVLLGIVGVWRQATRGTHSHQHLDDLLVKRGLMNRLFGSRLSKAINHSWQLYPLGVLFGLGFDTASEVALMAMTAGAAAGNLPVPAILCLPLLFAAGMSIMDTTDGVLMTKAYNWALSNPLRKIFYNIVTTGLSVVVALAIGGIEILQVAIRLMELRSPFFDFVAELDFGVAGYLIVGLFLLAWGFSLALWKFGRVEERYARPGAMHAHLHRHPDGTEHSHRHVH